MLVSLTDMLTKWWLKLILLAFFLLGVNACSASSSTPITIPPTTESPTQTTENLPNPDNEQRTHIPANDIDLEDVTILFWHPWTGVEEESVHALVEEFNQTNEWGIFVEDSAKGDESYLTDEILTGIDLQKFPDVVTLPIHFLSMLHSQKDVLVNLNPYIENPELGLSNEEVLTFPVTFWQQDIVDGFRFGVPAERDVRLIFYNRSWAQELGFDKPPADPDEFLNQACAAARENSFDDDAENNGTGGWIYDTEPLTVLSWFKAFKGGELPTRGDDFYFFKTEKNEEALAFLNRIYRISCAWIGRDNQPYQYFAKRQALFYTGWLSEVIIQEGIPNEDGWEILPFMSKYGEPVLIADGYSYGVMESDQTQQIASWLFIRWMLRPENQAKLIEATGTLPLTNAAIMSLGEFRRDHPLWDSILDEIPLIRPMTSLPTWDVAGRVLQDVAWQVTQSTVKQGDMLSILEQADKLLGEILSE